MFSSFMALLCAGTKSITSLTAFVCSLCRTQAITGSFVPTKAVQCIAMSLGMCWAGGFPVSSCFPAAPWAEATVRNSVHTANHETYQILCAAREASTYRHSPEAFCSVCLLSQTTSLAAVGTDWECWKIWGEKLTLETLAKKTHTKENGNK